ncbi:hypothetical protein [Kitasatospora sp. NPDC088548]|uniref:hypothetical protein n=1 Tax=Kitasatospora sp. NPDC088548 TaxID=3364075 RepID=UPI0037F7BF7D
MSAENPPVPVQVATENGSSTVFVAVVKVERREESGIFGPVVGLDAHLRATTAPQAEPQSMFYSRLAGETRWTADAHFGPNGFPHFSHGFGSLITRARVLTREIAALVDSEALRAGLVEAIDQENPLVLTGQQG